MVVMTTINILETVENIPTIFIKIYEIIKNEHMQKIYGNYKKN